MVSLCRSIRAVAAPCCRTVTTLNGNGNGNGALPAGAPLAELGVAATAASLEAEAVLEAGGERFLDPCETGHLEACATERIMSSLDEVQAASTGADAASGGGTAAAAVATPAGTPYASPGGRWANFQQYSIFQVRASSPDR